MTKDTLLFVIGGLIAFLPFLGFPHQWDTVFMVLLGASAAAVGVALRRDKRAMAASRAAAKVSQESAVPEQH